CLFLLTMLPGWLHKVSEPSIPGDVPVGESLQSEGLDSIAGGASDVKAFADLERSTRNAYLACSGVLVLLGVFTGLFAVPLQVFMQTRPPDEFKGRMIATQNLLNWVGILLSAALYAGMNNLQNLMAWRPSASFAMTALFLLPIVVFYHPRD
ncbi:MAG: hypothetical protein KDA60_21635, partial [Planctomycetales bacterium]|nr:hypothetical protein [Planctomycetales bacterium]